MTDIRESRCSQHLNERLPAHPARSAGNPQHRTSQAGRPVGIDLDHGKRSGPDRCPGPRRYPRPGPGTRPGPPPPRPDPRRRSNSERYARSPRSDSEPRTKRSKPLPQVPHRRELLRPRGRPSSTPFRTFALAARAPHSCIGPERPRPGSAEILPFTVRGRPIVRTIRARQPRPCPHPHTSTSNG